MRTSPFCNLWWMNGYKCWSLKAVISQNEKQTAIYTPPVGITHHQLGKNTVKKLNESDKVYNLNYQLIIRKYKWWKKKVEWPIWFAKNFQIWAQSKLAQWVTLHYWSPSFTRAKSTKSICRNFQKMNNLDPSIKTKKAREKYGGRPCRLKGT